MLPKPTVKQIVLYCFILGSFIPYLANSQPTEIIVNRPKVILPAALSSRHFAIDLDYPGAFELTIKSFNGNTSSTGFCEAFPARMRSRTEWTGRINTTNDEPDESGDRENYSYDNIVEYNGYFFILESLSFNITAIKDLQDPSSYITIPSEIQNLDDDEQLEETYLIVDPVEKCLYILTRKVMIIYPLTDFFNAINNKKPIPAIKNQAPNFKGYNVIESIKYYKRRLYVAADNFVEVFVISKGGQITPQIKFDNTFFLTNDVSLVDIAFKGDYVYVLDKLKGIYVVDISQADLVDHQNVTDKYKFQPEDTTEVQKGEFVVIVGDSLHVVTSGSKSQYLFEFIIRGDPVFLKLEFNRKTELFQSIKEPFADSNYLYLVTGFMNMVTKHSIPGRYHSEAVEENLVDYWSLLGAKALVSQVAGTTSRIVVLQDDYATVIRIEEYNPRISCRTKDVKEGIYSFKLRAIQKDCDAERNNTESDYNTVCEINQEIQLMMVDDSAIDATQIEESKKTETYLYIGLGVMALLVVIFICLCTKYKGQYQRLDARIKFQKLENDSQRKNDPSDSDINPYNINIQAELKKDEQKKKSPSPTKQSPNKSPNKKPNAEFGDIKPLDVDEIYGRKKQGHQDDDSF